MLKNFKSFIKKLKPIYDAVDAAVEQVELSKEMTGAEKKEMAFGIIKSLLVKRGITIGDSWINLAIEIAVAVGKLAKEELEKKD